MNETIRRETRVVAQASFLEGGLRVPLIVRWPARVPAGRVDKTTLSSGFDWLPTVLEIAGEIHARLRRDSDEIAYPTRRRRRLAPGVPELAARLPLDGRSVARAWTSSDADAAGAATHGAIFWGSVKKGRSFVRNVPTCRALCIRTYCAWSAAA